MLKTEKPQAVQLVAPSPLLLSQIYCSYSHNKRGLTLYLWSVYIYYRVVGNILQGFISFFSGNAALLSFSSFWLLSKNSFLDWKIGGRKRGTIKRYNSFISIRQSKLNLQFLNLGKRNLVLKSTHKGLVSQKIKTCLESSKLLFNNLKIVYLFL